MPVPTKRRESWKPAYRLTITDELIIETYHRVCRGIDHTDAPTEDEICLIRRNLDTENTDMLSLHWLRNRVVCLRKAGKLK